MTDILPSNQVLSVKALLVLFVWYQISDLSFSMDVVTSKHLKTFYNHRQLLMQMLQDCNSRSP